MVVKTKQYKKILVDGFQENKWNNVNTTFIFDTFKVQLDKTKLTGYDTKLIRNKLNEMVSDGIIIKEHKGKNACYFSYNTERVEVVKDEDTGDNTTDKLIKAINAKYARLHKNLDIEQQKEIELIKKVLSGVVIEGTVEGTVEESVEGTVEESVENTDECSQGKLKIYGTTPPHIKSMIEDLNDKKHSSDQPIYIKELEQKIFKSVDKHHINLIKMVKDADTHIYNYKYLVKQQILRYFKRTDFKKFKAKRDKLKLKRKNKYAIEGTVNK